MDGAGGAARLHCPGKCVNFSSYVCAAVCLFGVHSAICTRGVYGWRLEGQLEGGQEEEEEAAKEYADNFKENQRPGVVVGLLVRQVGRSVGSACRIVGT